MADLRELLGDDRYADVMERGLVAADKQGYYVSRGYIDDKDVERILAAALPDLLAEAWDDCTRAWQAYMAGATYSVPPSNPYRQEPNHE